MYLNMRVFVMIFDHCEILENLEELLMKACWPLQDNLA